MATTRTEALDHAAVRADRHVDAGLHSRSDLLAWGYTDPVGD
jgi:hypothetical protein